MGKKGFWGNEMKGLGSKGLTRGSFWVGEKKNKNNGFERKRVSPNASIIYLLGFKLVRTGNESSWQVLDL